MKKENWAMLRGLLIGIGYGLAARGLLALEMYWNTGGVMTVSFLFLVPFAVGVLSAYFNRHISSARTVLALLSPLFAVLGIILITLILEVEGIICVLMGLPIFVLLALLGSAVGTYLFYKKPNTLKLSAVLLLPFLAAPIESRLGLADQQFTEQTSIDIKASDQAIWQHITRVSPIAEAENDLSLFQILGFPRPLEAVLDTVAVGGVRIARFDRGLFFTETITAVKEQELLRFNIEADPRSIPPAALDEHVLVGDRYFDVMEGEYRLERLGKDNFRLHLQSRFRLSTSFNFYAGVWSQLIMRDIQNNILRIVKTRSERDFLVGS